MGDIQLIKKEVIRALKISGYHIRSELATFVAETISGASREDCKIFIDKITDSIQNQCLNVSNLEKSHLEKALREVQKTGLDETETVLDVINIFEIPTFTFEVDKKKFIRNTNPKSLLGNTTGNSKYWLDRYRTIWQRTIRHELFAPKIKTMSAEDKKKNFELKYVENLLAAADLKDVIVLGLLTQLEEGKYFLEDPSGVVRIDLSKTKFHNGVYTEGCFVIANGNYDDGVLNIKELGLPPVESGKSSRDYFDTHNYWGGPSKTLLKDSVALAKHEDNFKEKCMLFISDCNLNNPEVMAKLKVIFQAYESNEPIAIVLMGPFSSNTRDVYEIKEYFKELGEILKETKNLKEKTNFIIVPAIEDPAVPYIYPRIPLPEYLVSDLKKVVTNLHLATNPCRLQYCTQQLLIARIDTVSKMCRNTIHYPYDGDIEEHLAKTISSQLTLAPFDQVVLPIWWDFDACMGFYPFPDAVIIGDPNTPFHIKKEDCIFVNTGSFPSTFTVKVYHPHERIFEDCAVPDSNAMDEAE